MAKIITLIGRRATKGDVGVEIEVEGRQLKAVDNAVWRSEDDGSLRGRYPDTRCEYIFQEPIKVGAVKAAIKGLLEELDGAKFQFSYRTSVHVHVNVQQLEYDQLLSMMYTYYIVEEALQTFAGRERKGNNFCLRLADAEGVLQFVQPLFEMGELGLQTIRNDQARYSAMNIEALLKYGSLEFRGMKGNIDPDYIQKWASMLVALREFGINKGTPKKVYEAYLMQTPAEFLKEVFGKLADDLVYPKLERDIQQGFSLSIDLPFSHRVIIKKPIFEYEVGDIVGYEDAVKIQMGGGKLSNVHGGMYRVDRPAGKPREVKKAMQAFAQFAPIAPVGANPAWYNEFQVQGEGVLQPNPEDDPDDIGEMEW